MPATPSAAQAAASRAKRTAEKVGEQAATAEELQQAQESARATPAADDDVADVACDVEMQPAPPAASPADVCATIPAFAATRSTPSCCACAGAFVCKHFLPLGLVGAIALALAWPAPGAASSNLQLGEYLTLTSACVCVIFLISGLTLATDEIRAALRARAATAFGVASILFLTPLLALAPGQLGFLPQEFRYGLLLFCTMPTTINSGVALVRVAGGNVAHALLLTVASSLVGIFTAPFYLSLLLSIGGIHIEAGRLLLKMLATLLLPLLVGKLARDCSLRVRRHVAAHKLALSNLSALCLVAIPWMKLSFSQPALLALAPGALLGLLGCGVVVHLIYLAFNYLVAHYALRLPLPLEKSVVIMGSQKTLPMALTILSFFPPELGSAGLIALPPILSHIVQILIDACLCSRWAEVQEEGEKAPPPAAAAAAAATIEVSADGEEPDLKGGAWTASELRRASKEQN